MTYLNIKEDLTVDIYGKKDFINLKKKQDGEYYEDKSLASSKEVDSIPKSYKPRPAGNKLAPVAPKDMANNGYKKPR